MSKEATKAVRKGAAVLDAAVPDWWKLIDLTDFSLSSPCRCILGQVCGDYEVGMYELFGLKPDINNPDEDEFDSVSEEHGFSALYTDVLWVDLREAWIKLITKRRNRE